MLLAALLLLGTVGTAFAAEEAALSVTASEAKGQLTFEVAMVNAPGVTDGQITVDYDAENLTLVNAYASDVCAVASVNTKTAGKVTLAWVGSKLTEESTVLLTVVLDVKDWGKDAEISASAKANASGTAVSVAAAKLTVEGKSNPFVDIDGHWAEKEILNAYYNGLFTGLTKTEFGPEVNITRAMFVTVLYRMEGEPEANVEELQFEDVPANAYYAPAVVWATKNGITKGTSATTFTPDMDISRQEMVTMLYRYAAFCGSDVSASAELSSFADAAQISDWAAPAVSWAAATKLVNGYPDSTFRPNDTATRAQTAAVLCRYAGLS